MFGNKRFLYGLGTGIIIASLVLQLLHMADYASSADTKTTTESVFDNREQWMRQAEEWGWAVYPKTETRYTEDELRRQIEEAVRKKVEKQEAWGELDEDEVILTQKSIYITKGSGSEPTADMLFTLGLIEDKQLFIDTLVSKGLTGRIQTGVFVFEGRQDLEEIVRILTTPK